MANNFFQQREAGNGWFEYQLAARMDIEPGGLQPVSATLLLAIFLAKEGMESTMNRWLERIFASFESFSVDLRNGYAADGGELVAVSADGSGFERLFKQLLPVTEFIESSACPPAKLFREPILMGIDAMGKPSSATPAAGASKVPLTRRYAMHELVLMRRIHAGESFVPLKMFRLKPGSHMPVEYCKAHD